LIGHDSVKLELKLNALKLTSVGCITSPVKGDT
jgi:hypothetical protein